MAEVAVTGAEEALAEAEDGGVAEDIAAAQQALADAEAVRDALVPAVTSAVVADQEAAAALADATEVVEALDAELAALEAQLEDLLGELPEFDLELFVELLTDVAGACDDLLDGAAPAAPAAKPVAARASFTG